jgi:hypothetical protein
MPSESQRGKSPRSPEPAEKPLHELCGGELRTCVSGRSLLLVADEFQAIIKTVGYDCPKSGQPVPSFTGLSGLGLQFTLRRVFPVFIGPPVAFPFRMQVFMFDLNSIGNDPRLSLNPPEK